MRYQYTIRSALLVTAALAVLLAIRQSAVRKYEGQRRAAAELLAVGGTCTVEPIRPAPLRWLVADGDLGPVATVRLEGCSEPGKSLAALADLPDLERLYISNSAVTDDDLRHIAGLKKLRRLALWRTNITERGIRHLENLENLELLDIHGSNVGEDALPHLARLPHLRQIITTMTLSDRGLACLRDFAHHPRIIRGKIVVEAVTDQGMADLGTLTWITDLDIRGGRVSAAGYAQLRRLRNLKELMIYQTTCDDASLLQICRVASLRGVAIHNQPAEVSLGGIMRCWGSRLSHLSLKLTPRANAVEACSSSEFGSVCINFATADLQSLAVCRNCQSMQIRSSTLDGELLAAIGRMTSLTSLWLIYTDGKHWEGPAPGPRPHFSATSRCFKPLTHLQRLSLRCWSLDDDQLDFLNDLPALEHLEFHKIPISGAGFRRLRATCRLRRAYIGMCPEFNEEGLDELLRLDSLEIVHLTETGVRTRPSPITIKKATKRVVRDTTAR